MAKQGEVILSSGRGVEEPRNASCMRFLMAMNFEERRMFVRKETRKNRT